MSNYLHFPRHDAAAAAQNGSKPMVRNLLLHLLPHPHSMNTHIESNATHLLWQKNRSRSRTV